MVKNFYFLFLFVPGLYFTSCKTPNFNTSSAKIGHEDWSDLLQKHVDADGWVDYRGFKEDEKKLDIYLLKLSEHPPQGSDWSSNDKLAYWINAYNAFTIKLILDHYPVESIKDIKKGIPFVNSVWDIQFFEIGNVKMDLNTIEHAILRKDFDEPRIHFAINCASVSCPRIRNTAYTSEQIDQELTAAAKLFLGDPLRNKITPQNIKISKIFSWFGGDFKKSGSLIQFLNQYSEVQIDQQAEIEFLDYDWRLNKQKNEIPLE